jgi:hypothetical protein
VLNCFFRDELIKLLEVCIIYNDEFSAKKNTDDTNDMVPDYSNHSNILVSIGNMFHGSGFHNKLFKFNDFNVLACEITFLTESRNN